MDLMENWTTTQIKSFNLELGALIDIYSCIFLLS